MQLGTISYNNKIYNLDCMSSEEITKLLTKIYTDRKEEVLQIKKRIKE